MKPDQQKTLEWVVEFIAANGYAPTLREIRAGRNISSTSVVTTHLQKLVAAGAIKRTPNVARSIVILAGQ